MQKKIQFFIKLYFARTRILNARARVKLPHAHLTQLRGKVSTYISHVKAKTRNCCGSSHTNNRAVSSQFALTCLIYYRSLGPISCLEIFDFRTHLMFFF